MSTPTGKELDPKVYGSLPEDDWFRADSGNKLEDIFCKCCNPGPHSTPMGLMIALIGIKIRILIDLKNIPCNTKLAKEMLNKKFCTPECKKESAKHTNGCHVINIGRKEAISSTKDQTFSFRH